jgi:hypothetical protein
MFAERLIRVLPDNRQVIRCSRFAASTVDLDRRDAIAEAWQSARARSVMAPINPYA